MRSLIYAAAGIAGSVGLLYLTTRTGVDCSFSNIVTDAPSAACLFAVRYGEIVSAIPALIGVVAALAAGRRKIA